MTENGIGRCPGSPPWLWIWIVMYLMQLPVIAGWASKIEIPEYRPPSGELAASHDDSFLNRAEGVRPGFRDGLRWSHVIITRGFVVCVFIVLFTPLMGIAVFLMPRLRCRHLERKYLLKPGADYAGISSLSEIQQFVHSHVPGVEVYANPTRTGQPPYCYSSGYRNSRIAIFGNTIMLWHSNRSAAEAMLLHELSHAEQGEALLVGPAGLLQRMLRFMAWASGLMLCIPNLVMLSVMVYLIGDCIYHSEWVFALLSAGTLMILLLIGVSIAFCIWLGFLLFLPVFWISLIAAVWSAEINADYQAIQQARNARGLLGALGIAASRQSLWNRYLSLFTHPPRWLRRRLAMTPRGPLVFVLIAFPLSFYLPLIFLQVTTTLGDLAFGELSLFLNDAAIRMLGAFTSRSGRLVICGLLCLLWPRMVSSWKHFWNPDHSAEHPWLTQPAGHFWIGAAWCGIGVLGSLIDPMSAARGLVEFGM